MATDVNDLFPSASQKAAAASDKTIANDGMAGADGDYSDEELTALFLKVKKEDIDTRMVFVRQWHHHLLYFLNRMWIEYFTSAGGWRDKRLPNGVPRPVTNLLKKAVDTIRALFTSVQLGVIVRPNGSDPKNVAAAATADELAPVLHDAHHMNAVLTEFDFWLIVTGNAFLYTFLDYDIKYGTMDDPSDPMFSCADCDATFPQSEEPQGGQCPACGSLDIQPTVDQSGGAVYNQRPKGQPVTIPLSPLELAFSNAYPRFEELPRITRLRWRTKTYYENHPILSNYVDKIKWERGSGDLSLQIFKTLSQQNDLGLSQNYSRYVGSGSMGGDQEDGVTEYEIHYKPCEAYPKGLVFRVAGETGVILHLEKTEAIPGPLPYTDAKGTPLFTFAHAAYEHVGGRILGAGPFDIASEKNDQLNQLDSMFMMSLYRMSNPAWLVRKGSEPFKLTGLPGLVIKYDDPFGDGRGKPERLAGIDLQQGWFALRQQYIADFEDLVGTKDILGGTNPTDVSAFSALQLLDERSKGRFVPVLQARADAYRQWFSFAIELEREFGPDDRTLAVMTPARTWTFKNFKRAQLSGSITALVESGSTQMKTALGQRAALDHAVQMGFIDPHDPDQKYEALKMMGLTKLSPGMDIDVQSALLKQQSFEEWAGSKAKQAQSAAQMQQATDQYRVNVEAEIEKYKAEATTQLASQPITGQPMAPPPLPDMGPPPNILQFTPLVWRPWYNAAIHLREFLKWANGDTIRQLTETNPALVPLLEQHLTAIHQALPPPPPVPVKTTVALKGPDLADPQVRQVFDRANALPPGDPSMTPPKVGTIANPQVVVSKPLPSAASALLPPTKGGPLERSNAESLTANNEPKGFAQTQQNHGPM